MFLDMVKKFVIHIVHTVEPPLTDTSRRRTCSQLYTNTTFLISHTADTSLKRALFLVPRVYSYDCIYKNFEKAL